MISRSRFSLGVNGKNKTKNSEITTGAVSTYARPWTSVWVIREFSYKVHRESISERIVGVNCMIDLGWYAQRSRKLVST